MNRPTPEAFAACVYQVSQNCPGQDIAFALREPGSPWLSFAQMRPREIPAICAEIEALSALERVGVRLQDALRRERRPGSAGGHV